MLEELIADFEGTVLPVSHDRTFLDNIVTSTLAFEGDGRIVEYVGGWNDYLRQSPRLRLEREAKSPRAEKIPKTAHEPLDPTRSRKLSFNEQRDLSLPAHIAALETEQQRLQAESESSGSTRHPAIIFAPCWPA